MASTAQRPGILSAIADAVGACLVIALAALSLSTENAARAVPGRMAAGPAIPLQDDLQSCILDKAGYFHGQVYGAISATIDWTGAELTCAGMTRPDEQGVRLVFASAADGQSNRLIFVLGIDRRLDDLVDLESAVNITIIDERDGRFFGTRGMQRCWTTVRELRRLSPSPPNFRVDGDVYCAGSIPSLSDNASVTLGEFHFSGRLTLDDT